MSTASDLTYLDNNATTCVDPAVVEEMLPWLTQDYGNPSSGYRFGKKVSDALEVARERVAALLGCEAGEIIFTSCGTESSNAAIHSALAMDRDRQHIVTTRVEHSATLKTGELLAKRGHPVTWLGVNSDGQIDLGELEHAITDETALVSIMWANNETGVTFPVEKIAEIVREKGAVFHTDAVQTFGKIPLSARLPGLSAISIAGHKFYGPKGVGALYLGAGIALSRTAHGGSHENSRRPGTENVAAIVGMAVAAELAARSAESESARLEPLREELWAGIHAACPKAIRNGNADKSLANTLNVSFPGADGEALLMGLDLEGVCVSSGSACMVGSIQPSHVLVAMGVNPKTALATIRFSMGRKTTVSEISQAAAAVSRVTGLQPALAA